MIKSLNVIAVELSREMSSADVGEKEMDVSLERSLSMHSTRNSDEQNEGLLFTARSTSSLEDVKKSPDERCPSVEKSEKDGTGSCRSRDSRSGSARTQTSRSSSSLLGQLRKLEAETNHQRKSSKNDENVFEMTEVMEQECKEVFDTVDEDKSGNLSLTELQTLFCLMGQNPTKNEIETILKDFDTDGDKSSLSYDEFRHLAARYMKSREQNENELKDAFDVMLSGMDKADEDGKKDGKISKEEFSKYNQSHGDDPLTQEEIEDMFAQHGDDPVPIEEFIQMFIKTRQELEAEV